MKARRASRELALMALTQIDKSEEKSIEEILLSSIRTINNSAENNLKTSASALLEIREYVEKYEAEHPDNLSRPIEESDLPVAIPLTSDMLGRIDEVIDSCEKAFNALEAAEFAVLYAQPEVKDYTLRLINTYKENTDRINQEIQENSIGWNIDRIVKIDKNILKLAITELIYFDEIPISVAIDEAVELAKKYSIDKATRFINGILRQVVDKNNLKEYKKAK
ncbi:MAG: transcription antitermination factor NusB [Candidatus Gastranaerophilales bacterium]|nr:transcription antitermination factor NusB [Candidatus Gastranaerophilales bacterium]